LNSSAFRWRLNVVSDWTARSEDGREFQARAAATETLGRQVLNDWSKGRPESALRQTEDEYEL